MAKKQKALGAAKESADAISGTLEDYFASHRGSGEVSSHLLIGTPNHNAMASEPIDSGDCAQDTVQTVTEAVEGVAPSDRHVQDGESPGTEVSDKPLDKRKAEDTSVAGLTLGDYMKVTDDKDDSLSAKKKPEKKTVAPTHAKPKPKPGGAVVLGMSLDSYLGVAANGNEETDEYDDDNDQDECDASIASKKKAKKTLSPSKEAPKKSVKSKPLAPPAAPPALASEEIVTPFQRHQKKKQRAKNKLEQHQQPQGAVLSGSGGSGPVSRSILMADPLPSPSAHEMLKTNRKKSKASYQHQLSPSQSPLPKLAASPLISHSGTIDHLHSGPPTSIASAHHISDSTSSADKLPPL